MPADIRELLTVYRCPVDRERFGPEGDGGYVMAGCDVFYDQFVSCGIGGNVEFELAVMAQYPNLLCRAIDGVIRTLPKKHDRMLLFRTMVGHADRRGEINLEGELEGATDALLKMDIEGAEHRWILSVPEETLCSVAQLVIEVHGMNNPEATRILEALRENHNLIHVHGNNYGKLTDEGIPNVIELTYLRKDYFDHTVTHYSCEVPMKLDFPNNPKKPDLEFTI